jgi:hypothetical protein
MGRSTRSNEAASEVMSAGAAVQNNQSAVRGLHLHAGGVPPVANGVRPPGFASDPRVPQSRMHIVTLS